MHPSTVDQRLEAIRREALREAQRLSGEFARAAGRQREALLAEIELEKWVAESCQISLARTRRPGL